ncbi:MAG: hypothetical protein R2941_21035 [Desulfobacterales bacterium]
MKKNLLFPLSNLFPATAGGSSDIDRAARLGRQMAKGFAAFRSAALLII